MSQKDRKYRYSLQTITGTCTLECRTVYTSGVQFPACEPSVDAAMLMVLVCPLLLLDVPKKNVSFVFIAIHCWCVQTECRTTHATGILSPARDPPVDTASLIRTCTPSPGSCMPRACSPLLLSLYMTSPVNKYATPAMLHLVMHTKYRAKYASDI